MKKKFPNFINVHRPDFVERAESMLQDIKDPVLLILKGHLLVEEALYKCLCAEIHDLRFLEKANLRFIQKLYLVRGLHELTPDQEKQKILIYEFAEALNTLRNRYDHNLEPNNIVDLLPRLCVRSNNEASLQWDNSSISDLMISIGVCIGYFGPAPKYAKVPRRVAKDATDDLAPLYGQGRAPRSTRSGSKARRAAQSA